MSVPELIVFDTSLAQCTAAYVSDGVCLSGESLPDLRRHSRHLLALLHRTATAAGRRLSDAALLATTVGPGSFTGIRVGLATALGLAAATGRRALPLGTLDALAHSARLTAAAPPGTAILSLIEARNRRAYLGLHRVAEDGRLELLAGPVVDDYRVLLGVLHEHDLCEAHLLVCGDGAAAALQDAECGAGFAKIAKEQTLVELAAPSPEGLAALAWQQYLAFPSGVPARELRPLYLSPGGAVKARQASSAAPNTAS
ncbi:MAG: tRNA (adenosine(37)-N6)-threonylcarbamoyltransferase complex dimerization subunit type 1 TsaB [Bacillota bacterium]|nr:tRNA (adenosine(37)-N6)-threonylcarbamoyltransferase complex dimerization subunit type 1 TsaB [Bacillota bacterium]